MFVGVDGFRGGWVAVVIDDAGFRDAGAFEDFDELMKAHSSARVLGVDMPVGLTAGEPRLADAAARAFLGRSASSIFSAPPRAVLGAQTYDEARAISLRVSGKSLSKQSYNLCAKIREVDAYRGDPRMYEVHPETSFRVLAGEESVPSKKTWGGLHARLTLLREAGIEVPGHRASIGHVGIDDVVDAAAAAWSARRIGESVAITFPSSEEQRDADGRLIAIWA